LISNHFRDSVGAPEKAGVGGSIPSLATNTFNNLQIAKNIQIPIQKFAGALSFANRKKILF